MKMLSKVPLKSSLPSHLELMPSSITILQPGKKTMNVQFSHAPHDLVHFNEVIPQPQRSKVKSPSLSSTFLYPKPRTPIIFWRISSFQLNDFLPIAGWPELHTVGQMRSQQQHIQVYHDVPTFVLNTLPMNTSSVLTIEYCFWFVKITHLLFNRSSKLVYNRAHNIA